LELEIKRVGKNREDELKDRGSVVKFFLLSLSPRPASDAMSAKLIKFGE